MPSIDNDVLSAAIRRLERLDTDAELLVNVEQIVGQVRDVFASDGAGLMFLDDESALRYAWATDPGARRLEEAQEDLGHGPCVTSLVDNLLVATPDVQSDDRWPGLARLLEGSPVHAVLGIPVRLGGTAVGSLNVYRSEPHAWDDEEIAALRSFNKIVEHAVAASLLVEHRSALADQLQSALDTRVVIERAVGFLMARQGSTAVDAFDSLRRAARSERRTVADLAAEVLAGRDLS